MDRHSHKKQCLQSSAGDGGDSVQPGRLEELKQREADLAALLAAVRQEKLMALRSRPLRIGVVGFGRFGQFIAKTFTKHGRVVVTSRSDYTELANSMDVKYVPLSDPDSFLSEDLDVVVFGVSILSFKSTIQSFVPAIERCIEQGKPAPLIVDVASVKEHPRRVMLDLLPKECDVLCTHPMFGPDSGKDGWHNLNFVYEKTRVSNVVLGPEHQIRRNGRSDSPTSIEVNRNGPASANYVAGMDRMERFLSIWEEEGCHMVPMSCQEHDAHAANSQFITHLVGRVLGNQGLIETPIDTSGFQSVLKLIGSTTADSFDLFYGLYKYNQNSAETITQLQAAMNDVVEKLREKEEEENAAQVAREREKGESPPKPLHKSSYLNSI